MPVFTGSGVALITPFTENGINFDVYGQLIDFQIENATDAIVCCGTTGEPATMSAEEKFSVIDFCIKRVNKRVPVIVGTGSNSTAHAIADSKKAQELGADALLLVTPYYNKCTQNGLTAHFTAVADAVDIPVILYNVPSRTGVNICPQTVQKLAEHPNIVGLKEASGNIEQITEIARLCPDLDLYSGNDDHVLPVLSLGAKGVISVLANVAPQQTHDLVAAYMDGDIAKSRDIQFMVNPLAKALFCEVSPIPVKYAVSLLGYDAGLLRLPLTTIQPENAQHVKAEMQKLKLI